MYVKTKFGSCGYKILSHNNILVWLGKQLWKCGGMCCRCKL